MRFVPTVSRTSGTNFILSPNSTIIIYLIGNGYLHNCHKYNSNDANARLYFNYVLKIPDNVLVHFYFFLFSIQLDGGHPYDTLSIVLLSNFPKQTSKTNCTLSWVVALQTPLLLPQNTVVYFVFRNTVPSNKPGEALLWNKWHVGQQNMFTSVLVWQDTLGRATNVPPITLAMVSLGIVTSTTNRLCLHVALTNRYIDLLPLVFPRPGMHYATAPPPLPIHTLNKSKSCSKHATSSHW